MDNHTFGEPVPVVYYPILSSSNDDDVKATINQQEDVTSAVDEPSWTVDVIRKGSNVVVGTIVINNTKLPPRRNKNKKVVWKLPTTLHTEEPPRFGKQDYPRLWEIYKEEKKKRRSVNNIKTTTTTTTTTTPISSNNSCNSSNTNNTSEDNNDKLNHTIDNDVGGSDNYDTNKHDDGPTSKKITITCEYNTSAASSIIIPTTPIVISPPPGFESTTATTTTTTASNDRDRYKSEATMIRPPPGFS